MQASKIINRIITSGYSKRLYCAVITKFGKMLTLLPENKDITDIIVEKTDRLLRNFADHVIIETLMNHGGRKIHLVKESSILNMVKISTEAQ